MAAGMVIQAVAVLSVGGSQAIGRRRADSLRVSVLSRVLYCSQAVVERDDDL